MPARLTRLLAACGSNRGTGASHRRNWPLLRGAGSQHPRHHRTWELARREYYQQHPAARFRLCAGLGFWHWCEQPLHGSDGVRRAARSQHSSDLARVPGMEQRKRRHYWQVIRRFDPMASGAVRQPTPENYCPHLGADWCARTHVAQWLLRSTGAVHAQCCLRWIRYRWRRRGPAECVSGLHRRTYPRCQWLRLRRE